MPDEVTRFLELELDSGRYGVAAERVVEVAPLVSIAHLPGAPAIVLGAVRYRGETIAAIDLRARFGHARRPPLLSDHLVIVRTDRRRVALLVDRVVGIREVALSSIAPPPVHLAGVRGLVALTDDLIVLHDVEAVLSLDDHHALDAAMGPT